ncbi:alcohol dehydrogenase [Candidatus Aerophobetes bacterium]|uniref:Alcohol dehydrogenase n=1 Tax=Aerophobetes bacterium TaxID=2030807 RepID=A0A497E612_UNCAE|nr:alcohol dehydrogenase catalytic domain-containing protein [Candidatus Aerophobetes bacterium]RLE08913.1 MAG: alcohol dehydrogenase [Candidatus Aerophobetes bacterium]
MKAVVLSAKWDPKKDFRLGPKDVEGKLTYLGSQVWRNPTLKIEEKEIPEIGPTEVLIKVKACGICGSDVHMAQPDDEGYILYPGLTAFPCTLGHEFSGVVVKAGKEALNKRTGLRYKEGEAVTSEEMLWCGSCRPCADGYPNHCERLQELGFTCDGAFADYVKVDARYVWSLEELRGVYSDEEIFLAGSLVEPTSVAYNAVIERGGGIRPGDNVVILGGGPIGLAAVAILKRAGAAKVILSEPSEPRANMGKKMGADYTINPLKENFTEKVLEITEGVGAKLYLEATGLPDKVFPDIEQTIWQGKQINSTVVIVARSAKKIPVTGEVFQVRRASIVGSQGHSGHGTFPRVISSMASGMNMIPLITKKISLEEVPENIIMLQTNRQECKITAVLE